MDDLIGSLKPMVAKKQAIKQVAMQQLLTDSARLPEFTGKWATGRLKDVAYLHREHIMPSDDNHATYEVFSLPAYDLGQCPSVEPSAAIQSGKFRVPRDAVLLSRLNPRIPRVWAPPSLGPNAIASTEFLVLTPREVVDRAFLYWLCSSPQFCDQMVAAVTGTTGSHQRVNRTDAMNFPIRFPSLPEQRAIAAVLSDMDNLIGSLKAMIAKKQAIKQVAMQQLLTDSARLPEFTGKWATGRLKDVAYLHREHIMPSDDNHATYEVFSLPAYDLGQCPSVEPSAAIQSGKFRVPRDAVLLSRLNPRIPRVWAPPSLGPNAIASTEFLVLTPREVVDRAFLYWLCSSPQFCDQMVAAVTGTTGSHQRVNRTDAMNFPIRFPSLPEQQAIATVLSDMDTEIAALERRLDKTRAIKQGMMQQLLTGSIRLPVPDDSREGDAHGT